VKVQTYEIPGLLKITPRRFSDTRGWLAETWQTGRYRAAGILHSFVQDNLASSAKGVLRGLHAQEPHAQGKLVQVYAGSVFDVAVDVRRGSPMFGKWQGVILDAERGEQFYVPPGCLHGYYVLSDTAVIGYKTTDYYSPQSEWRVRWNDRDIGIVWPLDAAPTLSDKDLNAPFLADVPGSRLTPI
jgi:dTDP-4-dehydrorhamnose 3,5-epimerase